jgi:hypothetical protein
MATTENKNLEQVLQDMKHRLGEAEEVKRQAATQKVIMESLKLQLCAAEDQYSMATTENKKLEQVLQDMKHRLREAEEVKRQAVNKSAIMESLKLQLCVAEEKLSIATTENKNIEQMLDEMKHRLREAEQLKRQAVSQNAFVDPSKLQLCVAENQSSNAMPFNMTDVSPEDFYKVGDIHAFLRELAIEIGHQSELNDAQWSAEVEAFFEQELKHHEQLKQKCSTLESQVVKQDAVTESLKLQLCVAEKQLSNDATEKKKMEQVLQDMKHRLQEVEQLKSQAVNQNSIMESLKLQLCVAEEQLSNANIVNCELKRQVLASISKHNVDEILHKCETLQKLWVEACEEKSQDEQGLTFLMINLSKQVQVV